MIGGIGIYTRRSDIGRPGCIEWYIVTRRHYSVVAFDEDNIRALYNDLDDDRDIEVLSKTGLELPQIHDGLVTPIGQLFDGLTDQQLEAVRLALDNGYYEQPRKASISELAELTAVARSTFEEHLRKAENKLLVNIVQFVRLMLGSQSEDSLGVSNRATFELARSD